MLSWYVFSAGDRIHPTLSTLFFWQMVLMMPVCRCVCCGWTAVNRTSSCPHKACSLDKSPIALDVFFLPPASCSAPLYVSPPVTAHLLLCMMLIKPLCFINTVEKENVLVVLKVWHMAFLQCFRKVCSIHFSLSLDFY